MVKIDFNNILEAQRVTGCTLIGVLRNKFPLPHRGNCFSVATKRREFRIVNFYLENLEELIKRGLNFPVKIIPICKSMAIIHDERIPAEWYNLEWCETCCRSELLPIPQRLIHDLEIKQGVRTIIKVKGATCISINQRKKPIL